MKEHINNKKGITLTELIVAIFLLGLIIAIVLPIVSNTIRVQKDKLYSIQIDNIKQGATAWAGQNVYLMPSDNGKSISISLGELKSKGFVDKNLTNPKTENEFPDNVLITISKKNDTYLYTVDDSIGSDIEYDPEAPFIVLNGNATEYVELNGAYVEKGAQARDKDGQKINTIDIVIKKEGATVANIDSSTLATYIITYTATDSINGKSSSVSRNVVIHDTQAPIVLVNGRNQSHTMVTAIGSTFNIPNAVVSDNSGEILTPTLIGTVDTSESGSYELIYEAKDSSNNVGRLILTVIVKNLGDEIFINYMVSTSLWTNQDVTVTIMPAHVNTLDSQAYSFDGGNTWQASASKAFSSNQTIHLMARDNTGKKSEIVDYTISNIDKSLPTCSFAGNPTSWVASANITINTNDVGSGVNGIMIPGSGSYSNVTTTSFTVTDNGTYVATVRDVAGNTNTCSLVVNRIDKVSPTCSFSGNPTSWVKNATLTITGSDSESGVVGIQKPGDSIYTSTTSSTTFNVTSNGTYTAYVKDAADRIGTCSVSVTKVDSTPPTQPTVTL
jgi:competence protein ComGC